MSKSKKGPSIVDGIARCCHIHRKAIELKQIYFRSTRMKMTKLSLLAAAVLASSAVAFAPAARTNTIAPALSSQQPFEPARYVALSAEVDEEAAVDVPAPAAEVDELTKAESLGRGAAKVRERLWCLRCGSASMYRSIPCNISVFHNSNLFICSQ